MKNFLGLVLLLLVLFGVWKGWQVWQKYNTGQDLQQQQAAAVAAIIPEQLQGMPQQWEDDYKKATNSGTAAWAAWMRTYAQRVDDPRRAWIELDYLVEISGQDPQEARTIFSNVKERIPTNSPIYPRILQLEKTYQ